MKQYFVSMPFAGSICIPVEAETEEDAKEKAWLKCGLTVKPDYPECDIGEVEVLESIVSGNVCSAPLWETEVEEE